MIYIPIYIIQVSTHNKRAVSPALDISYAFRCLQANTENQIMFYTLPITYY